MTSNQRGSSLIETVLSISLTVTAAIGVFQLSLLGFSKLWLDHCLYESLICLAQGQPAAQCKTKLKQQLKGALFWGQAEHVHLRSTNHSNQGSVKWRLTSRLVIKQSKKLDHSSLRL